MIGIFFFVRPSRRGSVITGFLCLLPAILGMFLVYSDAKDCMAIATGDSVVKPSAMAQCVGRGLGTALSSLFGTSFALYVSLLALLRSWKRNRILGPELTPAGGSGGRSQVFQARVTRGLNAFEPPGQINKRVESNGLDLDDVITGSGVGFVPGSPIDAIAAAGMEGGSPSDQDDDDEIIDVEEVKPS